MRATLWLRLKQARHKQKQPNPPAFYLAQSSSARRTSSRTFLPRDLHCFQYFTQETLQLSDNKEAPLSWRKPQGSSLLLAVTQFWFLNLWIQGKVFCFRSIEEHQIDHDKTSHEQIWAVLLAISTRKLSAHQEKAQIFVFLGHEHRNNLFWVQQMTEIIWLSSRTKIM
jgi:hypothetical protein